MKVKMIAYLVNEDVLRRIIIPTAIDRSTPFSVEPYPSGAWRVLVKDEVRHIFAAALSVGVAVGAVNGPFAVLSDVREVSHDVELDYAGLASRARYACYPCGASLVRQPWMSEKLWRAEAGAFLMNHPGPVR